MKVREAIPCYYCGQPASDKEHVIEQSVLKSLRGISNDLAREVIGHRKLVVPSCRECNLMLVGTVQFTLAERKQFVKFRLRQRYRHLLMMPDWTSEQIEQMGPHMRSHIIKSLRDRQRIQRRLSW